VHHRQGRQDREDVRRPGRARPGGSARSLQDSLRGPVVAVDLEWSGELRFAARSGSASFVVDGDSKAAASPVQLLATALASCMAADLVDILVKSRLPLRALTARLDGARAAEPPRRLIAAKLHFVVTGDVPSDRIERAIALSHEKYCSVWHSLRQDIAFE